MSFNFSHFNQLSEKAINHVRSDVATLRTGRASSQLLDSVSVDVYESTLKINEVANISIPDAQLLIVEPWDKSILKDVEKAIAKANLNLNPVVDGDRIRIVVPALNQERRQEMVKQLSQKIESGRKVLRGIRSDTKRDIELTKGQDGVSEDSVHNSLKQLEKNVKESLEELEQLYETKKGELLTV